MPDDAAPGEESAYASYKRMPPSLAPPMRKSPAQVWHQILGHPSQEALHHLPDSAEGVRFTESPNKVVCESCKLAKSTELVSRRAAHEIPAKGPFERVSWDLNPIETAYNGDQYVSHFKCFYTRFNPCLYAIKQEGYSPGTQAIHRLGQNPPQHSGEVHKAIRRDLVRPRIHRTCGDRRLRYRKKCLRHSSTEWPCRTRRADHNDDG